MIFGIYLLPANEVMADFYQRVDFPNPWLFIHWLTCSFFPDAPSLPGPDAPLQSQCGTLWTSCADGVNIEGHCAAAVHVAEVEGVKIYQLPAILDLKLAATLGLPPGGRLVGRMVQMKTQTKMSKLKRTIKKGAGQEHAMQLLDQHFASNESADVAEGMHVGSFTCPNNNPSRLPTCVIPSSKVNDNQCDCWFCEDEDLWECFSCDGGCADVGSCAGGGLCNARAFSEGAQFTCRFSNGCEIWAGYVNDGDCDCPFCEDEADYRCFGVGPGPPVCAGGCPSSCGADYTQCKFVPEDSLFSFAPANEPPPSSPWGVGLDFYICDKSDSSVSRRIADLAFIELLPELNRGFRGEDNCSVGLAYDPERADARIFFKLRQIVTFVNDEICKFDGATINFDQRFPNLAQREDKIIKVFVGISSMAEGVTLLPWDPLLAPFIDNPHIFLNVNVLPNGSDTRYQLGRILVHELGHYFGLFHPWAEDVARTGVEPPQCAKTDFVKDTEVAAGEFFDCSARETCGSVNSVHNHMGFTPDECRCSFTSQQTQRMWWAIRKWLPDLATPGNPPIVGPPEPLLTDLLQGSTTLVVLDASSSLTSERT